MSQLLKNETGPESGSLNAMPWVEGSTRIFGVIAHPADHVRAPLVFNPRFAAAGLPHVMVPIDAPPIRLKAIIAGLRAIPNFCGLAVTIPHKMALADLCDTLGTAAELTGAVNAVRFDDDGSMHGDNLMELVLSRAVTGTGSMLWVKIFCSLAPAGQHAPLPWLCVSLE